MEVVTKFAVVAAVAVVFVGLVFGILFSIPSIPMVGNTGNPALDWTLLRDIIEQSCKIFGHYIVIPWEMFETAIGAIAAAVGIKLGTKVYELI